MHRSPLIIMQPDNARSDSRRISISLLLKIKQTVTVPVSLSSLSASIFRSFFYLSLTIPSSSTLFLSRARRTDHDNGLIRFCALQSRMTRLFWLVSRVSSSFSFSIYLFSLSFALVLSLYLLRMRWLIYLNCFYKTRHGTHVSYISSLRRASFFIPFHVTVLPSSLFLLVFSLFDGHTLSLFFFLCTHSNSLFPYSFRHYVHLYSIPISVLLHELFPYIPILPTFILRLFF